MKTQEALGKVNEKINYLEDKIRRYTNARKNLNPIQSRLENKKRIDETKWDAELEIYLPEIEYYGENARLEGELWKTCPDEERYREVTLDNAERVSDWLKAMIKEFETLPHRSVEPHWKESEYALDQAYEDIKEIKETFGI